MYVINVHVCAKHIHLGCENFNKATVLFILFFGTYFSLVAFLWWIQLRSAVRVKFWRFSILHTLVNKSWLFKPSVLNRWFSNIEHSASLGRFGPYHARCSIRNLSRVTEWLQPLFDGALTRKRLEYQYALKSSINRNKKALRILGGKSWIYLPLIVV